MGKSVFVLFFNIKNKHSSINSALTRGRALNQQSRLWTKQVQTLENYSNTLKVTNNSYLQLCKMVTASKKSDLSAVQYAGVKVQSKK